MSNQQRQPGQPESFQALNVLHKATEPKPTNQQEAHSKADKAPSLQEASGSLDKRGDARTSTHSTSASTSSRHQLDQEHTQQKPFHLNQATMRMHQQQTQTQHYHPKRVLGRPQLPLHYPQQRLPRHPSQQNHQDQQKLDQQQLHQQREQSAKDRNKSQNNRRQQLEQQHDQQPQERQSQPQPQGHLPQGHQHEKQEPQRYVFQQHKQQRQEGTSQGGGVLSDVVRNQILSLAMSGDLSKALQMSNVGQQAPHWQDSNLNLTETASDLRPNPFEQPLHKFHQKVLEAMQQEHRLLDALPEQQALAQQQKLAETGLAKQKVSPTTSPPPPPPPLAKPVAKSDSKSENAASKKGETTAPPSVVVPCRARGMTVEHNFQTACFVIRDDIKHGEGLICSFPACRNRGVKFLYCAYCRDPVAKRNFRDRHSHTDEEEPIRKVEADKTKVIPSGGVKAGQPPRTANDINTSKDCRGNNMVSSSSSNQTSEASSLSGSSSGRQPERSGNNKRNLEESRATDKFSTVSQASRLSPHESTRDELWAALLKKRPRKEKGDAMSAWLMQVMTISDSTKPLADVSSFPGFKDVGKPKLLDHLTDEGSMKSSSIDGDSNESSNANDTTTETGRPPTVAAPTESVSSSSPSSGTSPHHSSSDSLDAN